MPTTLETALAYIEIGLNPIPIPYKSKRPILLDWQHLRSTVANAGQYFNGERQNIGVTLGEGSRGLTDVDLDTDEALRAAPFILPRTHCFGRASKRASHWVYFTGLYATEEKATLAFKEGSKPPKTLLEVRIGGGGSGAQTIFPGSVHPCGEEITWEDKNEITRVDGAALLRKCAILAAVVILARHFPEVGGRHEAGLIIGAFLARCGIKEPEGKLFAEAICAATIQPGDKRRDIVRTVGDTIRDFDLEKPFYGFPKLSEVFGDDAAKKCAAWLGFEGETEGSEDKEAAEGNTKRKRRRKPQAWRAFAVENPVLDERGRLVANVANVLKFLRVAPELANCFSYNEMLCRTVLSAALPERGGATVLNYFQGPRELLDTDITMLQERLQHIGLPKIGRESVHAAVDLYALEHRYHPVREYLQDLKWDRVSRLRGLFSDYFGTVPSDYIAAIGPMFLVAMVARIFQPGCQSDYMIVLEGSQGTLKSTACKILAGEYFSDHLPDVMIKDASQHIQGKWLIEVAEMSSITKATDAALKAFLTRTHERYRPPYGRNEVMQPRQSVFVGTTNKETYLKDDTGGRRYWPVKCGKIDITALAHDRDQLFAEAVFLFRAGVTWWPDPALERGIFMPEQEARLEVDPWQEPIDCYIAPLSKTYVSEVAFGAVQIESMARLKTEDARRIARILKRLKWTRGEHKDGSDRFPWFPPRSDQGSFF